MSESKRILWLVVVMVVAVAVSTAVAITVLYSTAFEQERSHLIQTAEDQAKILNAVARFDQTHTSGESDASETATLSQIASAFDHDPVEGQIGEIVVAQLRGEDIVFLVTHGRVANKQVAPVPFDSSLAEPMRRALSGDSGSMIALDYRGETVLAAYHPVPQLNAGVVAKIDLAEIRAPFLHGAVMVIGLASVLITVGTVLFVRLTDPIVRHLNETEQRYQLIFRGAPVPIWEQDISGVGEALQELRRSGVKDLKRHLADHPHVLRQLLGRVRIKEANAAALALFGARSGRRFNAWFERSSIPAILDLSADNLQAMWDGCEALLNHTVSVKTLDGRDLIVNLSMMVPSASEAHRSVPVSALDVTAELNLRRREDELALILASTGEGIFGMGVGGTCTFVNRAALRMLGYRNEQSLLGQDMHSLIHHSCRDGTPLPREDCPILRACCHNEAVRLEDETLWRADGTRFPAQYSSYPMSRDGDLVGTVVTFTDITERKARDAQLLQSQKMEVVGQLTGAIAHDFNNLLTIILTNLHLLDEKLDTTADPEIDELLDDATSAARDGAGLTRRLLAFSRRQPLEPKRMDLDLFLEHTGRFLRRVSGEDIQVVVQRGAGPLTVHVDRQQLENTLLNLAINARDAMPDGGTLTIASRRQWIGPAESASHPGLSPGSYAVVSITDTGVGMSPESLFRAVEPFYSTKPMGKGTGLGLSTALGFAQQSGGDLSIRSAPGQGTTVSLFLPEAAPAASDTPRGPIPEAASKGSLTVLVVDDERRIRRLARGTLSELGYRVLEAENAAAAARLLEEDACIDLLFTDVRMPGEIDGRTLGQWARLKRPGLKVLLTSGFPQYPPAPEGLGGEPLPLLKKPYSKEQLQQAVQAMLSAKTS
ncbi:hybrid sensor histidine kinase/response regulator [Thiocapsa roseopersicina]|uniref:histidine kinase n=1 Tax=Thiocapsa roseopersicina TaxID=1058 RepID=A0A1H3CZK9_THIRO|nr:PAS domain-containing sensor histidine kinase [Thiocapsa roseopersicina]SDX58869.1 PAS domain S-box-containing protein [Thiocapsa roseopersicina]